MSPEPAEHHHADGPNADWPVPITAAAELAPLSVWADMTTAARLEEVERTLVHAMECILQSADARSVQVDIDQAPGWEVTPATGPDGTLWAILIITARGKYRTYPISRLN